MGDTAPTAVELTDPERALADRLRALPADRRQAVIQAATID